MRACARVENSKLFVLYNTSVVRELRVVNGFAERGVALMQAYNLALTKDEDQHQFLLQVEDHRKRYPDARKSTATAFQAT